MSSVIRSLMVKVGADLTDMQKNLKRASKDLKNVGKNFSAMGSTLTKGLTVPIIGATAGLTALAVKAGETADNLITMSNQTGVGVETLQELQYAARFVDVEVETMAKGLNKVVKAMGAAVDGGQDYIDVADGVQVAIKDANGNLLDSEDVFYSTIDALAGMTNETEREIAAQKLFGKSYQDLMPLIKEGTGALQRYAEEARNLGLVISEEDMAAMGAFDDKMQSLKAVAEVAGAKIGMAFMPLIEKVLPVIMEKGVPAIQKFVDWIKNLIEKFQNLSPGMQKFIGIAAAAAVAIGPVFTVVGKLTTGIGGLVSGIGGAMKALSAGSGLVGALSALLGPAGLALAAIAAIAAIAFLVVKNWDKIKEFFVNLWEGVKQAFSAAWEWIKNMFLNYTPLGLVIQHWDKLKEFFSGLWDRVKEIFSKAWAAIKSATIDPFVAGINLLKNIFDTLWTKVKDVFGKVKDWIFDKIGKAIEKISSFIDWIKDAIGWLRNLAQESSGSAAAKAGGVNAIMGYSGATYDVGTNYVPETGLALIHKGEAVIPADRNPHNKGYKGFMGGNVIVNSLVVREEADIKKVAKELFKLQKQAARGVGIA